jgi:putative copper resistance protein D
VTAAGILLRWLHLSASIGVVGVFAALLIAGRSDRPTALAWDARVIAIARGLVALAIVTGLATLAHQVVVLEGRTAALLDVHAVVRVVTDTQAGIVWLARHVLLAVLAAFLALCADTRKRVDWLAARGEGALLGAAALGLTALAGHAAAVEPGTRAAVTSDVVHLLASGVWIGALLPVAALARAASDPAGADARPHAVLAARRFSRVALASVLVLAATGVANAAAHVGGVVPLVGTLYGRLLVLKLGLMVPLLGIAAVNRRRLLPSLSADAETIGRPAMRRLARFLSVEAVVALAVLAVVATMTIVPPARHQEPTWPFTFRFALGALDSDATRTRVLVATQVAVLGAVAVLAALVVPRRRTPVAVAGVALVAAGAAGALGPLAVDAYPTTYRRPAVPYHATSIVSGMATYREHCAACHGPTGAGDGPEARGRPRPPADLTSAHTGQHTAGDLYWWITNGIPAGGMPAFGDRLGETERWDVINFVRTLAAAQSARSLGPSVDPNRPRLVAPDFTFTVGVAAPRTLRDYRGRRNVLVVLYTLPGSRPRLAALAASGQLLGVLGADVVAVPRDASPGAIRELGGDMRFLFPIVTEGAEDIVATFSLFTPAPHAEFLVDRQGYLRAMSVGPPAPDGVNALLAELQQLNEEAPTAPAADDHVH